MTNDRDNARKAKEAGIDACCISEYVEAVHPDLIDKVSGKSESLEIDKNINYPAHMSLAQVQVNIKAGSIIQGKLSIRRDNYLEGTILDGE